MDREPDSQGVFFFFLLEKITSKLNCNKLSTKIKSWLALQDNFILSFRVVVFSHRAKVHLSALKGLQVYCNKEQEVLHTCAARISLPWHHQGWAAFISPSKPKKPVMSKEFHFHDLEISHMRCVLWDGKRLEKSLFQS